MRVSLDPKRPPKARRPTYPLSMVLRLSLGSIVVVLSHAAATVALLEAWESVGRVVFVALATVLSAGAAVLMSVDIIRRTGTLYRNLQRPDGERVPPSRSAVHDALVAHRYLPLSVFLCGLIACGVEVLTGGLVSDDSGVQLAINSLMWIGMSFFMWAPIAFLTRTVMSLWIRPYDPRMLRGAHRPSFTRRVGSEVGVALAGLGFVSCALVIMHVEYSHELLFFVPAGIAGYLVLSVFLWLFVRNYWRVTDVEIGNITRQVKLFQPGKPLRMVAGSRVKNLASAVETIEARYASGREREATARMSMEQAQQDKTMLLARLTHDLRSPLNAIHGFADILTMRTDGKLNPAQAESVHRIQAAGQDLMMLLNDVLDAARFDAGHLQIHRVWIPSPELIQSAIKEGRKLIGDEQPITIKARLQSGLPDVYVDPDRIVQAILAFFRHSVRAMEEGEIKLRVRVGDDAKGAPALLLDVIDASSGIRSDDLQRVFEVFSDASEASGRRIGGLGLALSLARNLVWVHGGHVSCTSEEGKGTTFTVALPLDGPAEQPEDDVLSPQ